MVLIDDAGGRADHFVGMRTEPDFSGVRYSVQDVFSELFTSVTPGIDPDQHVAGEVSCTKQPDITLGSGRVPSNVYFSS